VIYDLSPKIEPGLAVWPGDTPMEREVILDRARGDSVTLSTLRATVHLGSHADGPNHYGGPPEQGVAELPLDQFIGPCVVLECAAVRGRRVRTADVLPGFHAVTEVRVLLKTGTYPDPTAFNTDFAALSSELVDALAARGVRTIGVDTPSVDLFSDKGLEAHTAILRAGIAILEGLRLEHVPPGRYELIAPPLRLVGFDASPVRALLRTI
jgi:arylformamidase